MKLLLKRIFWGDKYTIGKLYIDNVYFCDTLEDKDRGLTQSMSLPEIFKLKVKGNTCIPYGIYNITLNVTSPKYSTRALYSFCKGKLPRLLTVPGYDGVLIHIGNTHVDTEGCILVGQNKEKGKVLNSTVTFNELYKKLSLAKGQITIEIVK